MKINYPIVATFRDNTTFLIYEETTLRKFVNQVRCGDSWTYRDYLGNIYDHGYDAILRDDFGKKIDLMVLRNQWNEQYLDDWRYNRKKLIRDAVKNNAPIPRTGRNSNRRRRYGCGCSYCTMDIRRKLLSKLKTVETNMKENT
jgi:hypothetical protein